MEFKRQRVALLSRRRPDTRRIEKRRPIAMSIQCRRVEVRVPLTGPMWLTSLENGGEFEITTTENASTTGARVVTSKPWKPNESVLISQPPGFCAIGRIAYCHQMPSENFALGISLEASPSDWLQSLEDSPSLVAIGAS